MANWISTRTYIFSPDSSFHDLAFVIGVAHSHSLLPGPLLTRWLKFLDHDMPLIFTADYFTPEDYEEIHSFLQEIQASVMGPGGPGRERIDRAEKRAPREGWMPPVRLDEWRFGKGDGTGEKTAPKKKATATQKKK